MFSYLKYRNFILFFDIYFKSTELWYSCESGVPVNSTFIFQVIKKALKSRGVTYQELAAELSLSESGVKKLLTGKDISFQRLDQICRFLAIPLSEVVRSVERRQIREISLTVEQEKVLLQEPLLFRIYWRLSVERHTAEEIRAAENLDENQFSRLVQKLLRWDLVKIQKDGKILPLHRGPVRWIGQGPLLQSLNQEWSKLALNRSLDHKGKGGFYHHLMTLRLSDQEYETALRELNKFVEELVQRSERDSLHHSLDQQKARVFLLAANPIGFLTTGSSENLGQPR
jgi:transcriptional regulator with XRE-family HTH domain